jgi:hypothetical protein
VIRAKIIARNLYVNARMNVNLKRVGLEPAVRYLRNGLSSLQHDEKAITANNIGITINAFYIHMNLS